MPLSMSQASVPHFIRGLGQLEVILKLGEAVDPGLAEARLAPDMLPLTGQVQRASDTAKGCIARLSGAENPRFSDDEKTFGDLYIRIGSTLDFIKSVPAEQIDGSEARHVEVKGGGKIFEFTGLHYLQRHALPNFYFHISTAYAILRHHGVALSKRHYLG
jgi:hypothetical protein